MLLPGKSCVCFLFWFLVRESIWILCTYMYRLGGDAGGQPRRCDC